MKDNDQKSDNALKKALLPFMPQVKFASSVGVTQQAISLWLKAGRVPPNKVGIVSSKTGIPKHFLNPDFASEVNEGADNA